MSCASSQPEVDAVTASGAEAVFLALPHGVAAEYAVPLLEKGLRVIDLSADFRLRDAEVYAEFYGKPHPAPELLAGAVYGLPEIYADEIRDAKLVASPGCYPTSILLPLIPPLREGLIDPGSIVANSMSGPSGAGRKASIPLLYVECNESVRAYSVPKHRHLSEIEQELGLARGEIGDHQFHAASRARDGGNLHDHRGRAGRGRVGPAISRSAFESAYAGRPFVRLLGEELVPRHEARRRDELHRPGLVHRFTDRAVRSHERGRQPRKGRGRAGGAVLQPHVRARGDRRIEEFLRPRHGTLEFFRET